ncbi:secretogranin-2a [Festucalex cinctus]
MLSFSCNSARGNLVCLAQLFFVTLCLGSIHGATLREHRLRESGLDPPQLPNADIIKALEYIESLRQRTESQEKPLLPTENDGRHLDDAQKTRATLRLAPNPTRVKNDDEEDDADQERSEELLQAVLSTLQQTEKASTPTLPRPSSLGGGDVYPKVQKQQGIMPHKKMPLMFEDDEEGEGDEEEEEDDHESPFKRTNENVEEKYTPQNLATLQSVFDELDKFTNEKNAHKRQDEEDDAEEEEDEEGEDLFSLRNVVYDDEGEDLTDWGPLEEKREDEEEEEEDKHQLDRSLDYVDDEEEQDEDERYPVRRSDDPDQIDYYLLKVLERTEEEEQKRAIEEEAIKRAERRVNQYRDNIDPRVIYQLIQISQKYQIPPEDLLDMLKMGETSQRMTQDSRDKNKIWKTSSKKIYKIPQSKFYNRHLPARKSSPKSLQREAILNILGLGNTQNRDQTPARKPYRSPASRLRTLAAGRTGDAAPTQRRFPASKLKDYDDTADGELAPYLAAQMLGRYPGPAYRYGKAGQKRDEAWQSTAGSFEQAMQDYLDQMDSDKELNKKRQSEDGERSGDTQTFDNEAVMKLRSYFNPETEASESNAKAGDGI